MHRLPLPALWLAILTSGCAFHSTATHWNGRVGSNGEPIFVKSTTNPPRPRNARRDAHDPGPRPFGARLHECNSQSSFDGCSEARTSTG